jgi:hypothetical protein
MLAWQSSAAAAKAAEQNIATQTGAVIWQFSSERVAHAVALSIWSTYTSWAVLKSALMQQQPTFQNAIKICQNRLFRQLRNRKSPLPSYKLEPIAAIGEDFV